MKTKLSSLRQFLLLQTSLLIFFSPITAQIFWTEDFNGGLPDDWTALEVQGDGTESANWIYTTLGPANMPAIKSSTADNGWMLFDSDFNCSGMQEVRLISPRINCESKVSVYLRFETLYRRFNDLSFLEWSTDSIEWNAIPLFPEVTNSQYGDGSFNLETNPQEVVLDLTDFAAGEDSLFLAFKFLADKTTLQAPPPSEIGCAFSWQIDDLQLSIQDPTPIHDLRVNSFYAIAPNAITPYDQHTQFGFLADIQNVGQELQTGVKLSIQIKDDLDQVIYTDTLNYDSVAANTIVENEPFLDAGFLPNTEIRTYTGRYEIFADSIDLAPANNVKTFQFISSDSIFAKETGISFHLRPKDEAWPPNTPHNWSYGNYFFIPNGANKYASKVSFGLGNPADLKDQLLQIRVFKWENDNGDQVCSNNERTAIATTNYFVTGNEPVNQFITVNLLNGAAPIPLEDNTAYLVMIVYTPIGLNRNMELSVSTAFDYSAQWLRSNVVGEARFSSLIGLGNSLDYFAPGFGYDIVPAIRLHISDFPSTSVDETLAAIHQIRLSPNPAKEYLNINIQLGEKFKNLNYSIYDSSGKLMKQAHFKNIKEQDIHLATRDWEAGVYFIYFSSEKGNRSLSFVVL